MKRPAFLPKPTYRPPTIVHKGALKQFAGSPLGKPKGVDLLGINR